MPLLSALLALAAWKTYALGGLLIDLPVAPRTVANVAGQQTWLAEAGEGSLATVTVTPASPSDLPIVTLSALAQGAASGYHGRLVEQRDLVLNGWPGIEGRVEGETPKAPVARFRAYRVKDLLLFAFSTLDAVSTERAFASMAFAPRFGKGPQTQAGTLWKRAAIEGFSVALPDEPMVEDGRLTGAYGNRTYVLALSKDDPAQAIEAARKANGAKAVSREERIFADAASHHLEATAFDGTMALLAESFEARGRTVTLTALVPTALKDSLEVKRFFASFKVL